jgi:cytosol alanyl aminopeptidase
VIDHGGQETVPSCATLEARREHPRGTPPLDCQRICNASCLGVCNATTDVARRLFISRPVYDNGMTFRALAALLLLSCGQPSQSLVAPYRSTEPRAEHPQQERMAILPEYSGGGRLPRTLEPTRYRVRLDINKTQLSGRIEITGNVIEPARLIWLHGAELVVKKATATRGGVSRDLEVGHSPRPDQLLSLRAASPLDPGLWSIAIDYTAPIPDMEPANVIRKESKRDREKKAGLGVFRRVLGTDTYIFTNSEPIYARRIFPCIDEPDRKVPWQLTLEVDKDLIAASNTSVLRESVVDSKRKRIEFAETHPLPSYLIAFVVGPFKEIAGGTTKSGVPVRVLTPRTNNGDFVPALNNAKRILDQLEDFLGVPYPYGKLDLVSVPEAGWAAMENPGLVTFAEGSIEGTGNAGLVAHELAHQWFGNLVTLHWWNDIWLNESFAQWMAEKLDELGDNPISPAPRLEVLATLQSSAPVRREFADTAALEFPVYADASSIKKGIAILRLLDAYLGADTFRRALRRYIAIHSHGTVTTADLIAILERDAGKPLTHLVETLLENKLSTFEVSLACSGQPRLELSAVLAPTLVCVAYDRDGSRGDTCSRVEPGQKQIPLPARKCPRWIMPNAGGNGPYRIAWTKDVLESLLSEGWSSLTEQERKALFEETEDPVFKLAIFAAIARNDAADVAFAVPYLGAMHKYVPDDLRSRFYGWIAAKFGARARHTSFTRLTTESFRTQQQRLHVTNLVALTGDAQLTRQALPIAARYDALDQDYWFTPAVLTLAAKADQKLVHALLDDLSVQSKNPRRREMLEALSHVHGVLDYFRSSPQKLLTLTAWDHLQLFQNACDPITRSELTAIAGTGSRALEPLLGQIDACIAVRARYDPIFRTWLGKRTRRGITKGQTAPVPIR